MNRVKAISLLLFFSTATFATYCDISAPKYPAYNKTLDTVGDSITWWQHGEKFRCIMLDKGLEFDFVGSFVDAYGYYHDGHGGDTTSTVLSRMESIPISDNYFVLIGTNDHISPRITVNNILLISERLSMKSARSRVFISTLLPKKDAFSSISTQINELLRTSTFCPQCELVDLGMYVESLPQWETLFTDGIHPNADGYNVMTDYLTNYFKSK